MRMRKRQVRIAIAKAVTGATREFGVAERNQLCDRRDATILDPNLFQMRAACLFCRIWQDQFAVPVSGRSTFAPIHRSRSIQDQLPHRSRVTISCTTFLKKWATHKSLPWRLLACVLLGGRIDF